MVRDESVSGIWIYDSFEYPENKNVFMTWVIAEIDPLQYWRDKPLLIKRQKPQLYDAINLNPKSTLEIIEKEIDELDGLGTEGIKEVKDDVKIADDIREEVVEFEQTRYQQQTDSDEIIDDMLEYGPYDEPYTEYSELEWTAGKNQTVYNGSHKQEGITVTVGGRIIEDYEFTSNGLQLILDVAPIEGQLVRLVSYKRSAGTTPRGNITVFPLIEIPDTVEDFIGIHVLSDTSVLDKLAIEFDLPGSIGTQGVPEDLMELQKDLTNSYVPIQEQLREIVEVVPEEDIPLNQEERRIIVEDSWKPMGELTDEWYGIPIINIGPSASKTKDSFIVNVNSKNDWNVAVTNVVTTGLEEDMLVIDKQIPPGVKFMVGVYITWSYIGLVLRIAGDPRIYQKEIQVSYPDNTPQAISYAVDNDAIKSLSGNIWNLVFMANPLNYNYNVPSPEPDYPNDGWIYDFTDIVDDSLESIDDFGPTARAPGAKWRPIIPLPENIVDDFPGVHRCSFIYESYMDNFFCRNRMKQTDFTILWYQWLHQYPTGIHSWVSDPVYSNYLSYDYNNMKMILEFNGRKFEETLTLPENIWTQVSLRFDKENEKITFSFLDINYQVRESCTFEIGPNLEFELHSLFGEFNKEEREYQKLHQGLFGMVMIHQFFKTDEELEDTNEEVGGYLSQYKPTPEDKPIEKVGY